MCMAEREEGILVYNAGIDRYEFYSTAFAAHDKSFFRGSAMEIYLNDQWSPTRMEHNGLEWYLVGTGLAGEKLNSQKIRVKSINGMLLPY